MARDDKAIGSLIAYLRNTEIGGREGVNDRSMGKEKRTWDNDYSEDSTRVRKPTINTRLRARRGYKNDKVSELEQNGGGHRYKAEYTGQTQNVKESAITFSGCKRTLNLTGK